MKNELKNRAEAYAEQTVFPEQVYFTQKAPDARYKNYKYFFKYYNTNKVAEAFKTQKELEDFLNEKVL